MSFELPAGASLDEDGSDLVIKDSGGNIILRYDEGSSEWQFQSEALTGIGSLATEALAIGGHPSVSEVEFGTTTIPGPSGSSSTSTDTVATTTNSVTFSNTFSSTPNILATANLGGFAGLAYDYTNESTTGFDARLIQISTDDRSIFDFDYNWMAWNP